MSKVPITDLDNRNGDCRKTIRKTGDKTITAIGNVFSQKQYSVLFHFTVIKEGV